MAYPNFLNERENVWERVFMILTRFYDKTMKWISRKGSGNPFHLFRSLNGVEGNGKHPPQVPFDSAQGTIKCLNHATEKDST